MTNFNLKNTSLFDSIENFRQNSESDWTKCVQDLVRSKPFGNNKFYIFMFVKRVDDVSGIKKMFHQPRLTKPEPLPGTTLLRVDPSKPEEAVIIWTLPNQENFKLYKYKKAFADEFVDECVRKYLNNPQELMKREDGDLSESEIREIYKSKAKKRNK